MYQSLWGGRTSDKYITEHCNILTRLNPGNIKYEGSGMTSAELLLADCPWDSDKDTISGVKFAFEKFPTQMLLPFLPT